MAESSPRPPLQNVTAPQKLTERDQILPKYTFHNKQHCGFKYIQEKTYPEKGKPSKRVWDNFTLLFIIIDDHLYDLQLLQWNNKIFSTSKKNKLAILGDSLAETVTH